jgi:hypothetical protein
VTGREEEDENSYWKSVRKKEDTDSSTKMITKIIF